MKENKIEKLILDLSTRWECSLQEAVDRLNSMNESEINKLIKDMVKKFTTGGPLEDRVAFGTTERPLKFNPTEINPISKREAMQKYSGFGYNKGQLKRIYDRAVEHLGKDNAAKWMSAAWDQRAPGQTGYLVPVKEQLPWEKAPAMQSGIEMPVTNSDPQYYNGPRQKFDNGGSLMNCLRAGGTVSKCKCGEKVAKGATGMEMDNPPTRGTLNAYTESYPEFSSSDTTWTKTNNGGYVKNVFDGTTLDQNLVTYDENGTPRRSIRRISNYGTPKERVTYRDARGDWGSRARRFFEANHSSDFMDSVDGHLVGMNPKYINEREVKIARWKNRGNWMDKLRLAIFNRDKK